MAGRDKLSLLRRAATRNPDLIILDDGFHLFSIAGKTDLVLLDPHSRPDMLLPAGRMRLPSSFLRYADALIVTHAETLSPPKRLKMRERLTPFGKPVFFARHEPVCLLDRHGRPVPLSGLARQKILAVCGIAKPDYFFSALGRLAPSAVCAVPFPDHFRYSRKDARELAGIMRRLGLEACVTTEKDLVKLNRLDIPFPLYALKIRFSLENEVEFRSFLGKALTKAGKIV